MARNYLILFRHDCKVLFFQPHERALDRLTRCLQLDGDSSINKTETSWFSDIDSKTLFQIIGSLNNALEVLVINSSHPRRLLLLPLMLRQAKLTMNLPKYDTYALVLISILHKLFNKMIKYIKQHDTIK
jgi:hypothetical protein